MALSELARPSWAAAGHRRVALIGLVALVVVLGGGAAAWAAAASGNAGYRTATVTRADIGQSMTVVGTVEPVSEASAAFQVGGKVQTLTVAVR